MISKASLNKFKEIYRHQFNEDITDAEALELATKLINLYKIIYLSSYSSNDQNENKQNTKNNQIYENRRY